MICEHTNKQLSVMHMHPHARIPGICRFYLLYIVNAVVDLYRECFIIPYLYAVNLDLFIFVVIYIGVEIHWGK